MAIRYLAHGHALFCSWPYAILHMAIRYFAHDHTLFRSWPYAILLMAMRYFAHGHTLFSSWPCAIFLMAIRYSTYGHTLFFSWSCAILLMAMRYFSHGHTLFCSWSCAIFLMATRYFAHGDVYFVCRSCSKCKWRKGRSAFRKSSRLSGDSVQALYDIHDLNTGPTKRRAKERLMRWGFNPKRRCLLPTTCRFLLVKRPGYTDELFPGLDYRDRLHGLTLFLFRNLQQILCGMGLSKQMQLVLDQRVMEVGIRRVFRTSETNRSYRVQRSLFSDANMSGADKSHWIFLLPHVLGPDATCLPEPVREPFLMAIARAQLMIIASRGLRPYNEPELHEIYDRGYVIFFGAMERIHQINHDRVHAKRMRRHRRNPDLYQKPKRFKRQTT